MTKMQREVRWQMADYDYEEGRILVELTHEEEDELVDAMIGAKENDLISYWEILPASPMSFEEFRNIYGADFDMECPAE